MGLAGPMPQVAMVSRRKTVGGVASVAAPPKIRKTFPETWIWDMMDEIDRCAKFE